MNPASILAWLEANATQVLIQTVPAYRRAKNRVVVGYRDPGGQFKAVGGFTIRDAVMKAAQRAAASNVSLRTEGT